MMTENQQLQLPKQLLLCEICKSIFFKPITLSCGHTFCKGCLKTQMMTKRQNLSQQSPLKVKQKLNKCHTCSNIIWKDMSSLLENLVVKNLIEKFYPQELKKMNEAKIESMPEQQNNNQNTSQYYNKIVIKIKEPSIFPMPCCYSQIQFSTAFIDDVIGQSHSLVLTWDSLLQKKLGLLCTLLKVQPLNTNSTYSKIIYNSKQSDQVLQQKYKGMFQGIQYVKIQQISSISINLRHKLIIISQQNVQKIMKNLEICNCSVHHAQNHNIIRIQQLKLFLDIYDNLNNHHLMKQIKQMIFDGPFQNRGHPQATQPMIYCILRLLKIPNQLRKKLVLCFNDVTRIEEINSWLLSKKDRPIEEIINIKIPGKYNTGLVFFIIFILLAFNLFQDYNNKKS